jgi:hypothetical protein
LSIETVIYAAGAKKNVSPIYPIRGFYRLTICGQHLIISATANGALYSLNFCFFMDGRLSSTGVDSDLYCQPWYLYEDVQSASLIA